MTRTYQVTYTDGSQATFHVDDTVDVTWEDSNEGTVVVTSRDGEDTLYVATRVRELRDIFYQTRVQLGPEPEL